MRCSRDRAVNFRMITKITNPFNLFIIKPKLYCDIVEILTALYLAVLNYETFTGGLSGHIMTYGILPHRWDLIVPHKSCRESNWAKIENLNIFLLDFIKSILIDIDQNSDQL
uniref:Uncharacterized protein n=1 Tax=Rhizophagus irregularis (strain DAOM 181602 / DAOM 197198 / MUCL 43194) TaxID=747089 RepID=U9ULC7_RHIID